MSTAATLVLLCIVLLGYGELLCVGINHHQLIAVEDFKPRFLLERLLNGNGSERVGGLARTRHGPLGVTNVGSTLRI